MKNSLAITLFAIASPAFAAVSVPSGIPRSIAAPAAVAPAFALTESGVQVYECSALGANSWGWAFVAPDATLYDGTRAVGTHTMPDVWESSTDRSSLTAVPRSTQAAGAGNLPWAAWRAAPLGGTGMFAGVTFMQRINTQGGVPAPTGCGEETVGQEVRVPFRADYYFYKPVGAG